jgi:hypothetical protein
MDLLRWLMLAVVVAGIGFLVLFRRKTVKEAFQLFTAEEVGLFTDPKYCTYVKNSLRTNEALLKKYQETLQSENALQTMKAIESHKEILSKMDCDNPNLVTQEIKSTPAPPMDNTFEFVQNAVREAVLVDAMRRERDAKQLLERQREMQG